MLRNRLFSITGFIVLLSLCNVVEAQQWSGLLSPTRAIDWSEAGAGTIAARTTICQTLGTPGQAPSFAQSVTAANISSALTACAGTNQAVLLNPGTYTMTQTLVTTANNVTLRGSGPQQTILNWTAMTGNCLGIGATGFCAYNGSSSALQYSPDVCTVSAGVSQGSTSITLGTSVSGSIAPSTSCNPSALHVGSLVQITQVDDAPSGDNGQWYQCGLGPTPPTALCTWGGASNGWVPNYGTSGNPGRTLTQNVTVTAVSGSNVTFAPALYAPKWSQTKAPYANFSTNPPLTGFGIENLQLNTSQLGDNEAMLNFIWTTNSWVKNVALVAASVNAGTGTSRKHILTASSSHLTIRDSYFYGSGGASDGYGVDLAWGTSDTLVENNIFQHISTGTITENASGNVFGYNYAVDNFFQQGAGYWQQCDAFHHDAGDHYNLWEGHEGICMVNDDFHGTSFGITAFRSYFSGFDKATTCPPASPSCGTTKKLQSTPAIENMAYERYANYVGNVLGTAGYHNTYQNVGTAGNPSTCTAYPWTVIWSLNFSDQNQLPWSPACISSAFILDNDPLAGSTMVRWGNYDVVNGSVQTNSSETASSAPVYPGLASPSTSWSSYKSLYLPSQPSWWGSMPWPAVGPDVTGGNVASVGGHAYHNPAANCYLNILGGKTDGSSGPLSFDANNCYPTVASAGGPPPPPSNLTGTVQ